VYSISGLILKNANKAFSNFIGLDRVPALQVFLNRVAVFILVTFAWIFFRAENFQKASQMIHKLCEMNFSKNMTQLSAEKGPFNLLLSFVFIGVLFLSYRLPKSMKLKHNVLFLFATILLIIILGKDAKSEFIYFQF